MQAFELMNLGKLNGYICQGFNPVGSFPDKKKIVDGLSEAQVPRDHRSAGQTETSRVLEATSASTTTSRPAEIQTTVFRLPSTCFAEEDGSLTNSSRWLQWHFKRRGATG